MKHSEEYYIKEYYFLFMYFKWRGVYVIQKVVL